MPLTLTETLFDEPAINNDVFDAGIRILDRLPAGTSWSLADAGALSGLFGHRQHLDDLQFNTTGVSDLSILLPENCGAAAVFTEGFAGEIDHGGVVLHADQATIRIDQIVPYTRIPDRRLKYRDRMVRVTHPFEVGVRILQRRDTFLTFQDLIDLAVIQDWDAEGFVDFITRPSGPAKRRPSLDLAIAEIEDKIEKQVDGRNMALTPLGRRYCNDTAFHALLSFLKRCA